MYYRVKRKRGEKLFTPGYVHEWEAEGFINYLLSINVMHTREMYEIVKV